MWQLVWWLVFGTWKFYLIKLNYTRILRGHTPGDNSQCSQVETYKKGLKENLEKAYKFPLAFPCSSLIRLDPMLILRIMPSSLVVINLPLSLATSSSPLPQLLRMSTLQETAERRCFSERALNIECIKFGHEGNRTHQVWSWDGPLPIPVTGLGASSMLVPLRLTGGGYPHMQALSICSFSPISSSQSLL